MSLRKKLCTSLNNIDLKKFNEQQSQDETSNNIDLSSKYFFVTVAEKYIQLQIELIREINLVSFTSPVDAVYNPIEYAFDVFKTFVHRYLNGHKKILFLGLNPGPFGMGQTGVPFGSITEVRDWLQITGKVNKPINEIPARPVLGFDCQRTEISGKRFWGVVREICKIPENFFKHSFVHNLCPLLFLSNQGRNITPSELKGDIKQNLMKLCEQSLLKVIQCIGVDTIVCIGRIAQTQTLKALKSTGINCKVEFLPHPSPRTVGNTNWNPVAIKQLQDLNLMQYLLPQVNE